MHFFTHSVIQSWPGTLLLSTLVAVSGPAWAKQKIDETIETSATPNVEIEHIQGRAVIKTWDRKAVRITGELSDQTTDFEFAKTSTGVSFDVDTPRRHNNWRNYDIEEGDALTIFVPVSSKLDYSAVSASVTLSDITNETVVDLVNGDIEANQLSGRVTLETVNGDITMKAVRGELTAETVNGDIKGDHSEGNTARLITVNGDIDIVTNSPRLRIESVNGKMEFKTGQINGLDVVTVNGSVQGDIRLASDGNVDVSSVGGKVKLRFQPDVSARFDIQAHAGGSIENHLTDQQATNAKYGPNKWLEFTTGQGNASVEISTVHGTIILDK